MDSNLRREIILDNYQDPMNRGLIEDDSYLKVNTNSESCIDNLDFMMKIEDGVVKDIRFDGEACAISTSATSIMIHRLIGKSVDEVKRKYWKSINICFMKKNMMKRYLVSLWFMMKLVSSLIV